MSYKYMKQISVLCPECGNVAEFSIDMDIYMLSESDKSVAFQEFDSGNFTGLFRCKKCSRRMVQIDAEILDTVRSYNLAGIRTKYSCAGHVAERRRRGATVIAAHRPYIIFSNMQARNTAALIRAYRESNALLAYGIHMDTDSGDLGNFEPCTIGPGDLDNMLLLEHVRVTLEGTSEVWSKGNDDPAKTYLAAERQRFNDGAMMILRKVAKNNEKDQS